MLKLLYGDKEPSIIKGIKNSLTRILKRERARERERDVKIGICNNIQWG